jgi:hypothetical protein
VKHARPDYDRIQDPAHKIPEDEPVFLLRGQDRHAAEVVRFYAHLLHAGGGDPELFKLAIAHADRMEAWPVKKAPDL